MENKSTDFKVLSGRSQLLLRPQMWLGSIDKIRQNLFVISDNKAEIKELEFIPALRKIIDEVLDNALDVLIKHAKSTGTIRVKMEDDNVQISDNGCGIPVRKQTVDEITDKTISQEEVNRIINTYIPEHAWCRLFSGSNFSDSENKTTIGSHGVGSTASNVFSIKFIGHTDDGKKSCTVTSIDNMSETKTEIGETSGKTGTTVHFWPDLKRFKVDKIDQVYFDLVYQRLLCLAITFPKINFYFNGKKIIVNDQNFLKLFSEHVEMQIFKNGFVGIIPNEQDEFNFFSYVNGLALTRGGSHVDFIVNNVVNQIRDKLVKKFKTLKPADVKNRLTAIVFLRDLPNPKFDSQTKETLTNAQSEISKFIGDQINFEQFSKNILKNDAIIDPIIESFKIKEELKARSEFKGSRKTKIKSDKYLPPVGRDKKFLALCEGLSAMSGISACLGRKGIGYYAMRGLPINAYSQSIQKIAANQEFKEIMSALGLDISSHQETKTIQFENIMITSDSDADGAHIASMLLGWFKRFGENLFHEHRICRLVTPLILVQNKNDKIVEHFFNVSDFKNWSEKHGTTGLKFKYLKGLGSWEKEDLTFLLDKYGLEHFIQYYQLDDSGKVYMEDWLGDDPEPRKNYLKEHTFDIDRI